MRESNFAARADAAGRLSPLSRLASDALERNPDESGV